MNVDFSGVKNFITGCSESELQQKLWKAGSWEFLYHLSNNRENLVEWLPIQHNTDVAVEVCSQCGALTGALAKKYSQVVCLETSDEMNEINQMRHKDQDNISYVQMDVAEYALGSPGTCNDVYMIGCLPEAGQWYEGDDPFTEMLQDAYKLLGTQGRLILAIENKLGLKYWAGCQEEHNGGYYINLENYPNGERMRTFSRRELLSMLKQAGFETVDCYYPYPGIYFPNLIHSENCLPRRRELLDNIVNFDRDRYLFFDEAKVFDTLIGEGLYQQFANGFLLVAWKGTE
jgi:hypothetical protein